MSRQIMVIILLAMLGAGCLGYVLGKDSGYYDGRDYVCNSPQVPFKTVTLPACTNNNATDDAPNE